MPKGSNCALVHEFKPNLQVGCFIDRIELQVGLNRRYTRMAIFKSICNYFIDAKCAFYELHVINVQMTVSNTIYRRYTRMAIKSVWKHLP